MASPNTQRAASTARNGASEPAQSNETSRPSQSNDTSRKLSEAANEALSTASTAAQQATEGAKQSAAYAANMLSGQIKELLDQQVVNGANMIGHVASSAQLAADDLDQSVPQVAKLVRGVADRIENVADDIRDQTAQELVQNVADFTRRQPALTFGLAALAGFFVFRALKSSAPAETPSPSIQPDQGRANERVSHGA
jgi:ElaB/YqjD/DUF883 family membrane-anchored ribosome-binding protein